MRTRLDASVLLSSGVSCLTADEIVALASGHLTGAASERATAHLDECNACRDLLVAAANDDEVAPGRGDTVGRYLVLGPLGAGAMGVVLEAYDPELDRKVAIKLLRAEHVGRGDDARLQSEARALARLSHPNVVAVYDVGKHGDELFIAMELVAAETLSAWRRDRAWPEVLGVLLGVGEGLAAAHAAGVIHRDVKPDNVLVPADGRPRVTDFGLARSGQVAIGVAPADARTDLSRTGAITGTPMYMAPELLAGARADERSDLFGFAVTAFEALFGQRPFTGDTIEALAAAIRSGRIATVAGTPVPSAVRAIVVRGLAAKPGDRWASMREMLDALARAQPRRTRWRMGAAAVGAAGLAALLGAMLVERDPPCTAGAETIAPLWNDARKESLRAAFADAPTDRAAAAFVAVDTALTRWTNAWAAGLDDACAATHVRGTQSATLLDARGSCLERARVEVDALVDALAHGEDVVDRAATVIEQVPNLELCANVDAMDRARASVPTDPGARRHHDELERRFAEIAAQASLDRANIDDYVALFDEAVAAGFEGLAARIGPRLALAHGSGNEALSYYGDAAARAFTVGDDDSLARAWLGVAEIAGRGARIRDAELAAKQADAAIVRLGDPIELRALWHHKNCIAYSNVGDLDRALETCTLAVETEREASGGDGSRLGDAELSLAIVHHMRADETLALAGMTAAAERYLRLLGPGHTLVDNALANVAEVQIVLGRHDEALPVLRELVLRRPTWLHLRDGLAAALRAGGDHAAALREGETMLASCARSGCPFWVYIGTGEDRLALGDPAGAAADFERARASDADMPAFDRARVLLGLASTSNDPTIARALADDAATAIADWAAQYGGRYAALHDRARALAN